jgi:hypothetical protein
VGVLFGAGQRMLFDAQQRFVRSGQQVYLRVKNFSETQSGTDQPLDYLEVGVPFAATGTDLGYKDLLIKPPPGVQDISLHDIGVFGGRLNFGSRVFWVSHTFVLAQMSEFSITDPREVFRNRDGKPAVGLFYDSRLFSIEDIQQRVAGGEIIRWKVLGNALEATTSSPLTEG